MTETKPDIDEESLQEFYGWMDEIPLSRPKKDLKRDFADGVLVAELVHHFCPRIVDLHNYPPANQTDKKLTNWRLLNRKVFRKLQFELEDEVIQNVVKCKPWCAEQVLMLLRRKIDRYIFETKRDRGRLHYVTGTSEHPEADQGYRADDNHYMHLASENNLNKKQSHHSKPSTKPVTLDKLEKVTTGAKAYTQMVPKMVVEEREQELLAKEETIQILHAKIRRLEHLIHLKDIRVDDLQQRLDRLDKQFRPTAHPAQPSGSGAQKITPRR